MSRAHSARFSLKAAPCGADGHLQGASLPKQSSQLGQLGSANPMAALLLSWPPREAEAAGRELMEPCLGSEWKPRRRLCTDSGLLSGGPALAEMIIFTGRLQHWASLPFISISSYTRDLIYGQNLFSFSQSSKGEGTEKVV